MNDVSPIAKAIIIENTQPKARFMRTRHVKITVDKKEVTTDMIYYVQYITVSKNLKRHTSPFVIRSDIYTIMNNNRIAIRRYASWEDFLERSKREGSPEEFLIKYTGINEKMFEMAKEYNLNIPFVLDLESEGLKWEV